MYDWASRLLALTFALSAVFLAGGWLTELTAPRPVARLPSTGIDPPPVATTAVGRLFGVAEAGPRSIEGLSLTGLFVGSGGGGFATFQVRGAALSAFPGDEVMPGVQLKQIERDHVILLASGTERTLRLPAGSAQAVAPDGAVQ